jgi:outer membrane immunogenic protein
MFTSLGSKAYNLGGDVFDSGTVDFHTIKVGVNYHFR